MKNGSHGTIHTFKNYFATVFSVFNNKRYPNTPSIYQINKCEKFCQIFCVYKLSQKKNYMVHIN